MNFKLYEMAEELSISRIANVHFFEFPKGYKTKEDQHAFCELLYVNNGALTVYSEDYNGTLKKNEFIIHLTNKKHSLFCAEKNETTVIIIGFECNSKKLEYFSKAPIKLDENEINQLAQIVKEGRNVFAPPYNVPVYDMQKKKNQIFGCEQMLHSFLECFLINLVRKYDFKELHKKKEIMTFQVNEILQYLKSNFREKITIDELAFLFHTNRTTLCKEFKKSTNCTVNDYITYLKIEKAKDLLTNTINSISEISENLNFDTDSHFCAFFKKNTGITPFDYRKTMNVINKTYNN